MNKPKPLTENDIIVQQTADYRPKILFVKDVLSALALLKDKDYQALNWFFSKVKTKNSRLIGRFHELITWLEDNKSECFQLKEEK